MIPIAIQTPLTRSTRRRSRAWRRRRVDPPPRSGATFADSVTPPSARRALLAREVAVQPRERLCGVRLRDHTELQVRVALHELALGEVLHAGVGDVLRLAREVLVDGPHEGAGFDRG